MEPEFSVPFSQQPANCPSPDTAHHFTPTCYFLKIHFNVIHLRFVLPRAPFLSGCPTKTLYAVLLCPLHAVIVPLYSSFIVLLFLLSLYFKHKVV